MNRIHALVISVLLAAAAVAGASAALKTLALGPSRTTAHVPDAQLASRRAKLDRAQAALERARRTAVPALPKVPHFAPVAMPAAPPPVAPAVQTAAPAAAPATAPVKYVQAAPVVQVTHAPAPATSQHGDDGQESETEHHDSEHPDGWQEPSDTGD